MKNDWQFSVAAVLLTAMSLSACGQKGPLTLPAQPAAASAPSK